MKIIQQQLYEAGDLVQIVRGYSVGMVGRVVSHDSPNRPAQVLLADSVPSSDPDDDEDDNCHRYEICNIKLITKTEYDKVLKDKKILTVPGLLVPVQIKHGVFMFGDNEVKPKDAVLIAQFIMEHQVTKKVAVTKRK